MRGSGVGYGNTVTILVTVATIAGFLCGAKHYIYAILLQSGAAGHQCRAGDILLDAGPDWMHRAETTAVELYETFLKGNVSFYCTPTRFYTFHSIPNNCLQSREEPGWELEPI